MISLRLRTLVCENNLNQSLNRLKFYWSRILFLSTAGRHFSSTLRQKFGVSKSLLMDYGKDLGINSLLYTYFSLNNGLFRR